MSRLKRIGVLSAGMTAGLIYAAIGFLAGVFIALFSVVGGSMAQVEGSALGGIFGGVAAVVVIPIVYGLLGAVMAMLMALIYNLAARFTGGIELELE